MPKNVRERDVVRLAKIDSILFNDLLKNIRLLFRWCACCCCYCRCVHRPRGYSSQWCDIRSSRCHRENRKMTKESAARCCRPSITRPRSQFAMAKRSEGSCVATSHSESLQSTTCGKMGANAPKHPLRKQIPPTRARHCGEHPFDRVRPLIDVPLLVFWWNVFDSVLRCRNRIRWRRPIGPNG